MNGVDTSSTIQWRIRGDLLPTQALVGFQIRPSRWLPAFPMFINILTFCCRFVFSHVLS